jgi:hypothetical protein
MSSYYSHILPPAHITGTTVPPDIYYGSDGGKIVDGGVNGVSGGGGGGCGGGGGGVGGGTPTINGGNNGFHHSTSPNNMCFENENDPYGIANAYSGQHFTGYNNYHERLESGSLGQQPVNLVSASKHQNSYCGGGGNGSVYHQQFSSHIQNIQNLNYASSEHSRNLHNSNQNLSSYPDQINRLNCIKTEVENCLPITPPPSVSVGVGVGVGVGGYPPHHPHHPHHEQLNSGHHQHPHLNHNNHSSVLPHQELSSHHHLPGLNHNPSINGMSPQNMQVFPWMRAMNGGEKCVMM